MREKPSAQAEVVSQTVFSERLNILDAKENFLHVETPDGYLGWVSREGVAGRKTPYSPDVKISRLAAHLYLQKNIDYGPVLTLPYGSELLLSGEEDERWVKVVTSAGSEAYIQKGDIAPEEKIKNKTDLALFSKRFLDLPYTWGGRSSFGFDCSGFIQMLYGKLGIQLKRDTKEQILDSRFKDISIKEIAIGDLIFWGASPAKIFHVGMYAGDGMFIHATSAENKPWIRISSLSDPAWVEGADSRPYRKIFKYCE